ncbi:MAG: ferredoxin--NADP reductase [Mycobacteriaceae bacterium]|nr:ferredoxin--NADP reductase [Mycobacteriaceae bacterium]
MNDIHRLRVHRVIAETDDARSIEFEVPAENPERFTYKPGQFLTLRVPSDRTGSVARCYSLSSAPHEGGPLKVTVKRTADGYASNWLCDNAEAGMDVDVLVPAGIFTPKNADADLLLFAGGSGITPVMSILKSALAGGTVRVALVYANQDDKSVIFADELAELARAHPDRLVVVHWLVSVQGLPSVEMLTALVAPWREREAFICGPGPFMEAAQAVMTGLGAERRRVHVETFKSLPRPPFEIDLDVQKEAEDEAAAAADASPADANPVALTVELDGQTKQFTWPRQQKLLDFLLAQGLAAPYSCREGACSACACRIVAGEVKMLHNEVLEPEDIDEGIVLACQSVPLTDDISVSYE